MDLNLLIALDTLLETNSVIAAAERLHLTPPAVSRTLSRIRHVTGDDILVRSGRTMTPTPYALAIRDEVHALVDQAQTLLKPRRRLDLATLDRVFTIRGHDVLVGALAPALTATLAHTTPNLRVRWLAEAPGGDQDLIRGQVDLEIGATEPSVPEIVFEKLATDRLVAVFRHGHPLARDALTTKRLARVDHVTISRRGRFHDAVDDALAAQGLERRVLASLPTASLALAVVAQTDVIAIVAETLCKPLCDALGLETRRVPIELMATPVILAWHRRHDSDPAHAWLRTQVVKALSEAMTQTKAIR
ncbi:DNA-binding transcriptional LysR family regulator [Rhodanobacter sp. K2T2]|uniref:LysR family transcriptional regulator n=1 Tax=Rhodanobacter sp. K2T2 TaxID=2723085 RepID=UPI0015CCEFD4|nr:LysR family transcriptional regulator [Rhodanobacter sp. K2T2]NYE30926.1 DNA-binding transcriptional LysR family regulator [Rhodanobacter sp. K2T2]